MGIDDLSLFTEVGACDVLARSGLKELQLRKVIQAVAPPLASVSLSTIVLSSPLSRHLQCEWAALKKDGYTARELRPAGCNFLTARDVGFDLPSLKDFRAAGCSC